MPDQLARPHTQGMTVGDVLAAVIFAVSGSSFIILVVANYAVFSPDPAVQRLGTDMLIPFYAISVDVLRLSPFDEGLWAFLSFCSLLLSISVLRARRIGIRNSIVDSLTAIGPAILFFFELGIYAMIPSYFHSQVTNFVGYVGLGHVITNWSVLVVSAAILSGRVLFDAAQRVRKGKDFNGP